MIQESIFSQNNFNFRDKYYFIEKDSKSYLLKDLFDIVVKDFECKKENFLEEILEKTLSSEKDEIEYFSELHLLKLKTPTQNSYGTVILNITKTVKEISTKIIEEIKKCAILDKSRTAKDEVCSLSLEEFKKPYLLNINGRTYSKKYIKTMIEKALYKDESLRLEDVILRPSMIDSIELFPNLSLWKGAPPFPPSIKFSANQIQTKPFDLKEAQIKNINGFSEFVKNLPPNVNNMWDIEKIYNFYTNARDLPQAVQFSDETIENLIVQDITFPPHHPKCDVGSVTFRNILFEKCNIIMECWCGVHVRSSRFVNCVIDLKSKTPHFRQMGKTKLVNCTIIAYHLQPKGIYKEIDKIPSIVKHIFNMVENANDLENCTLEIV